MTAVKTSHRAQESRYKVRRRRRRRKGPSLPLPPTTTLPASREVIKVRTEYKGTQQERTGG